MLPSSQCPQHQTCAPIMRLSGTVSSVGLFQVRLQRAQDYAVSRAHPAGVVGDRYCDPAHVHILVAGLGPSLGLNHHPMRAAFQMKSMRPLEPGDWIPFTSESTKHNLIQSRFSSSSYNRLHRVKNFRSPATKKVSGRLNRENFNTGSNRRSVDESAC